MSNLQNFPPALRFIIVSAVTGVEGDSLDQLSSFELPDGCLISVAATGSLYRFVLGSTATATVGTSIVLPPAGPGAFEILVNTTSPGFQMNGSALLAASAAYAETDNTWVATPSGTGFYALGAASGLFTLDTATGIVTYNGPPNPEVGTVFRVKIQATISASVAGQSVEIAPSLNGSFIGTTSFIGYAGVANVSPTTANLGSQIATEGFYQLGGGNTLQAIVRDTSASNNITVSHISLIISPV